MSVNVGRLRAELEFITANPEQWEQRLWAKKDTGCGSACCLAGWTVVHEDIPLFFHGGVLASETLDGRMIGEVAREILGLEFADADWLFACHNTLYDLWSKASDLTDGAIQIPASLTEEVAS